MKKKILVLGINSFLGSNFFSKIIRDSSFKVFGTINKNSFRINKILKNNKIKKSIYIVDLSIDQKIFTDLLISFKPNIIINFTGNSHKNSTFYQNELSYKMIKNILNSIKESQIELNNFYNIGSCEEYCGSNNLLTEKSKLFSKTYYGNFKIKIHKYLSIFSKRNNFDYTNLRTFNVIGGDVYKENIIEYINNNIKNKKIKLRTPYSVRDYIWIKDYLNCIIQIIKNNKKNFRVINIGTGNGTSLEYIYTYIASLREAKNNYFVSKNIKSVSYEFKIANTDILKKFIDVNKFLKINKIIMKVI